MKKVNNIFRVYKRIQIHRFLFLILSLTLNSYSQTSFETDDLRIKYFTLEDGLSQVTINDLYQDKSGFVWMTTDDGLNRFDGKEFKHYKYNSADTTTISGNQTTKLLEDRLGNLWIGTIGDGLNYYDKDLDIFHRIKLKFSDNDNEHITDIESDEEGIIWISSRNSGLHRLQGVNKGSFSQKNYFEEEPLTALLFDSKKKLWAGSFAGHVFRLDSSHQPGNHYDPEININSHVRAFYEIGDNLLIGSDLGLFIYDVQSNKFKLFELEKTSDLPAKHIGIFLKASDSTVWIGSGSGLYLFDWTRLTVLRKIEYSENGVDGLSNNTVQSLLKLPTKQILVGTANYLNLLDFTEPYFNNISKDIGGDHLLNDNIIFSILKDNDDLWIGTSDGGLNLIRHDKTYYFKEDQNNPTSISGSVVRAIAKDEKNQRLWIATTRGLSMINLKTFDPNNPKFTVFKNDPENSNTINLDFLKDLMLDKNNNVWGATYGKGIFRLEMSDDNKVTIYQYKNEVNNLNSLRNDITQCIREDNDNNIWIGTRGGLTKLHFQSENYNDPVFTNFYKDSDKLNSLSNNSVYDILFDKENQLWVGTRYGLNLFLKTNEFKSWIGEKQFADVIVYSIQDDESGNLWLGTNNGIVRFESKKEKFMQFDIKDGIQSKEFDIHAKFRDKNGNIYMGGTNGVTYFHPDNIKKIDIPISIYFSQLRVKDEVISTNNTSKNSLKQPLFKTNVLEFKHNQFPFYLQFSSIDFRWDQNIEYAYKLLPTDNSWNMLTDLEIQFLNLPSGSYTLQVNGFSRGKEWDQDPIVMDLLILPPWWATWWAYLVYLGIAVLLSDRFYRFQLSKRLAVTESVRLKDINKLKNNFYTNITHEFRTPLTVILGMVDTLKSTIIDKQLTGTDYSLELIKQNGNKLLLLVNEMLDLTKLESGKMQLQLIQTDAVPFVKYLCESFHSLAEEKQINLIVYSEIDELFMDFDANKLSTIISNLLSNAIKFTPENGKIIVHLNRILKKNQKFFIVKVKDDGFGISERDLKYIFNRFYQVDDTSSRYGGGTGIGLSLTKEFVELMDGSIKVNSISGKGSEFIIQLPISNKAIQTKDILVPLEPKQSISTNSEKQSQLNLEENLELPLALIIEDNADVFHYLKSCLVGKYQTIYAKNGEIGIDMAFEKVPDIVICDVMMPVKDGFEVCSTLKSDERTDHIPIILLTAKVAVKDRLTGLSCGADGYLTKPFIKAELLTRIDQLILLRKKMMHKIENDNFSQFLKNRAENPETRFLQKIIKIIHDEISNHSFGSSLHLSHKMHLSESQIYRKLKAITGKSTAIFIRSVRLQMAKKMILSTDKTISEIAYDVGFNDPSWFSRAFKEEFGFSPSEIHK